MSLLDWSFGVIDLLYVVTILPKGPKLPTRQPPKREPGSIALAYNYGVIILAGGTLSGLASLGEP